MGNTVSESSDESCISGSDCEADEENGKQCCKDLEKAEAPEGEEEVAADPDADAPAAEPTEGGEGGGEPPAE